MARDILDIFCIAFGVTASYDNIGHKEKKARNSTSCEITRKRQCNNAFNPIRWNYGVAKSLLHALFKLWMFS